jgi:2-iminobutanoate/2-iminopropanoate deaminase
MAKRRHIILPTRKSPLPFSDGVLVDGTLYIAGRIGIDPATGMAPADLDQEIRLLLDDFETILRLAGMTMNDLVWVQIFSPDVSLWDRFNAAYVKRFSGNLPARAFLGSGTLLRGGRFEMMGIAVQSSRRAPGGGKKRKGSRKRRSKK